MSQSALFSLGHLCAVWKFQSHCIISLFPPPTRPSKKKKKLNWGALQMGHVTKCDSLVCIVCFVVSVVVNSDPITDIFGIGLSRLKSGSVWAGGGLENVCSDAF